MNCQKCGVQIPEDSSFCTSCGASQDSASGGTALKPTVETTSAAQASPAADTLKTAPQKNPSVIAPILGLVVGTICLLYGLAVFFGASCAIHSTSFGGDFYTYTYRGIVAIAESQLAITKLLAMLCIGFGGFMDCYFLKQLLRK